MRPSSINTIEPNIAGACSSMNRTTAASSSGNASPRAIRSRSAKRAGGVYLAPRAIRGAGRDDTYFLAAK
jgi:hypothetical protein